MGPKNWSALGVTYFTLAYKGKHEKIFLTETARHTMLNIWYVHHLYIDSGHLPSLKECPWGQKLPRRRGHI